MKKITGVLLSILFVFPILVGMVFVAPSHSPATLNGGGGGNPLI